MLQLSEENLSLFLDKYQGRPLDNNLLSGFEQFSTQFFVDDQQVNEPRVEVTTQLNISEVYQTYLNEYSMTPGATFTAYIKWIFLKILSESPYNWRFINNQWYEFERLPLELSVVTNDQRGQALYFIDDAANLSWENFCVKHTELAKAELPDDLSKIKKTPMHAIAHEIVGLHIPGILSSYKTTRKVQYSHHPWVIFNTRYEDTSGKLWMPCHISFSHATGNVKSIEALLNSFTKLASKKRNEHWAFLRNSLWNAPNDGASLKKDEPKMNHIAKIRLL